MENSHLSSFDIRVFYVRITNFDVPQYLSLTHIPLELNGARCPIVFLDEIGNTNYLNQESQNMKLINGSKMMHLDFTCGNSVPEEDCSSLDWDRTEYLEGGELSWFNAGVRVGVGIILEICVDVGVGVGLLVRTFQTTTRTVKRRLL
ncbi:hypothetical protein LIER_39216 [Lithospermum erythrorhizon]|uniref:Uncharacterized protein n=1 Tax=Lithospermum erythrorhizon TaxID=34254 RepID=A0AAV3QE23_LITER